MTLYEYCNYLDFSDKETSKEESEKPKKKGFWKKHWKKLLAAGVGAAGATALTIAGIKNKDKIGEFLKNFKGKTPQEEKPQIPGTEKPKISEDEGDKKPKVEQQPEGNKSSKKPVISDDDETVVVQQKDKTPKNNTNLLTDKQKEVLDKALKGSEEKLSTAMIEAAENGDAEAIIDLARLRGISSTQKTNDALKNMLEASRSEYNTYKDDYDKKKANLNRFIDENSKIFTRRDDGGVNYKWNDNDENDRKVVQHYKAIHNDIESIVGKADKKVRDANELLSLSHGFLPGAGYSRTFDPIKGQWLDVTGRKHIPGRSTVEQGLPDFAPGMSMGTIEETWQRNTDPNY